MESDSELRRNEWEKEKQDFVTFITHDVPIYFFEERPAHNPKATVYWTVVEDWREWGLKEITPWVSMIILDYDEDEEGTRHQTREITSNIIVEGCHTIPLRPVEVLIRKSGPTMVKFQM